jgi:hypothetical protein|tara:strand:+ start:2766 stop:3098 length:333 start_codon:yes stop_codon:yes gene_type:complete
MAFAGRKNLPLTWHDATQFYRLIVTTINGIMNGGWSNAKGEVTLTASATTTTITHLQISQESVFTFEPTTESAALCVTSLYVSSKANGSAVITHNSREATDRTFNYSFQG